MPRKETPSVISKKLKRRKGSRTNLLPDKSSSTDKLVNSWRLEIRKRRFLINRSPKLRTKPMSSSKIRRERDLNLRVPSRRAEKTKSIEKIRSSKIKRGRRTNSLSSGSLETRNSPLLSNKKGKRRDREGWSSPTTSKNRPKRKISSLSRSLSTSRRLL